MFLHKYSICMRSCRHVVWQPGFHRITHRGHPSVEITEDLEHHLFTAAESCVHYMTCVIWLFASSAWSGTFSPPGFLHSANTSLPLHPRTLQGLSVRCPFCAKFSFLLHIIHLFPFKFPLKCFFLQEVFLDIYPQTLRVPCALPSWYLSHLGIYGN